MARLLISCGEASGDLYAAELIRHLRKERPDLEVRGLGGDGVAAQGGSLLAHSRDVAVVGLAEVVRHLPRLRALYRTMVQSVVETPPAAALLVDYPGFNLRLAAALHARGVPVVYYVSPQVWAWRRGRVRAIRRSVDHMIVIFPFEEALYQAAGVPVTFAGHPLVDLVRPPADPRAAQRELGLDPERPVLALLPGSRPREVAFHMPVLAEAAAALGRRLPALQCCAAVAPGIDPGGLDRWRARLPALKVVAGRTYDLLATCTAAVVASGTATVEAALLGAPMVVVYRLSALTYLLGRPLVSVPHVAMANLIVGRRVVPELIQADFTAPAVVSHVEPLLLDPSRRERMRADLGAVRTALGGPGASWRAAKVVADVLGREEKS
jgi:lipid-A-disaccharide synthase